MLTSPFHNFDYITDGIKFFQLKINGDDCVDEIVKSNIVDNIVQALVNKIEDVKKISKHINTVLINVFFWGGRVALEV